MLPTDQTYTGQRLEDFGLLDYHARYYDPALGRFISADTIIPEPRSPLAWDRYAYANNSPVMYTDPDGHIPALIVTALIGAGIAAGFDYGFQVIDNIKAGQGFDQALVNIDVAEVAGAAVAGGIAGGTLGLGTAALAAIGGTAATTSLVALPVAAVAGGIGNGLGGQVGALAEAGVRQIGNEQFDQNEFYSDAFSAGFANANDFMWDVGSGAILGAGGQAFSNLSAPSNASRYRFYDQIRDLEGNIIRTPQNTAARLPGESSTSALKGPFAGSMRKVSDFVQEFISQLLDRRRSREE